MNISTLEQYVAQRNEWNRLTSKKPKALSLMNPADRQEIADSLDCELSPENLHCDGEISNAQAMQKYRYLTRCAQELLSIDPSVQMYEYGY
jgi:hypothetical protein